ncbi:MAG TPA: hypothetical protein VHP30_08900, partial [Ignavibacteriales bacterium]|nr:hypothetical protein [Ignavibacteriales bacterium]
DTPTLLYKYYFANPIQKAFFKGTFRKIGIKKLKWINLAPVKMVSGKRREKWLYDMQKYGMCLNK